MTNKQNRKCPDCGAKTQETHIENFTGHGYTKITGCTKCQWFQTSVENIGQQVAKPDISQDYPVVEMLTNMVQEQQLKLEKQSKELELLKARVAALETMQNSINSMEYNNGLKQLAMREANRIKSERE